MKPIYLQAGENKGHYAPGVISNGTLYVSGQLSLDLDTREVCPGGIRDHVRLALHNLERVLTAAGCGKEDVVFCRLYIQGMENWNAANEVYAEFFGSHKPARVVLAVPELHFGCLAEVEAVAEVREGGVC